MTVELSLVQTKTVWFVTGELLQTVVSQVPSGVEAGGASQVEPFAT